MPHEQEGKETKVKIDHIFIKVLDDGTYLYKSGNMDKGNMREYSASDSEELMRFVKDDVMSPHMKAMPSKEKLKEAFHEVKKNEPEVVEKTRKKFGKEKAHKVMVAIAFSKARRKGGIFSWKNYY